MKFHTFAMVALALCASAAGAIFPSSVRAEEPDEPDDIYWTDCGAFTVRSLALQIESPSRWATAPIEGQTTGARDRSIEEVLRELRAFHPDAMAVDADLRDAGALPLPLVAYLKAPNTPIGHFLVVWDVRDGLAQIVDQGSVGRWVPLSDLERSRGGAVILLRPVPITSPTGFAFLIGLLTGTIAGALVVRARAGRVRSECPALVAVLLGCGIGSCGRPSAASLVPVTETSVDLGVLPPNAPPLHTIRFRIRNTGTETRTAREISSSCGCSKAELIPSAVAPGQESELVCAFTPGEGKEARATVTVVFYNGERGEFRMSGFKRHSITHSLRTRSVDVRPWRTIAGERAGNAVIEFFLAGADVPSAATVRVKDVRWVGESLTAGTALVHPNPDNLSGTIEVPLIPTDEFPGSGVVGVVSVDVEFDGLVRKFQHECAVTRHGGLTSSRRFVGPEAKGPQWGTTISVSVEDDIDVRELAALSLPYGVTVADGYPKVVNDRVVDFKFSLIEVEAGNGTVGRGIIRLGSTKRPSVSLTLPVALQ